MVGIPYRSTSFESVMTFCKELKKAIEKGRIFRTKEELMDFWREIKEKHKIYGDPKDTVGTAKNLGLIDKRGSFWYVTRDFKPDMTKEEYNKLRMERFIGFKEFIKWAENITKTKGYFTKNDIVRGFIPKLKKLREVSDNEGTMDWTIGAYINEAIDAGYIYEKGKGKYAHILAMKSQKTLESLTKTRKFKFTGVIRLTSNMLAISISNPIEYKELTERYPGLFQTPYKERKLNFEIVDDKLVIDLSRFKKN